MLHHQRDNLKVIVLIGSTVRMSDDAPDAVHRVEPFTVKVLTTALILKLNAENFLYGVTHVLLDNDFLEMNPVQISFDRKLLSGFFIDPLCLAGLLDFLGNSLIEILIPKLKLKLFENIGGHDLLNPLHLTIGKIGDFTG